MEKKRNVRCYECRFMFSAMQGGCLKHPFLKTSPLDSCSDGEKRVYPMQHTSVTTI